MKQKYTKKQITEAIAYWKKQLKSMNEAHKFEFTFSIGKNAQPHVTAAYGNDEDEAWKEVLKHNPNAKKISVEMLPNEDDEDGLIDYVNDMQFYDSRDTAYLYITTLNSSFGPKLRKIGSSDGNIQNPESKETLKKKLIRYSTCVPFNWTPMYQILLNGDDAIKARKYEEEFFDSLDKKDRHGSKELFKTSDNEIKDALKAFKVKHPNVKIVKYPPEIPIVY